MSKLVPFSDLFDIPLRNGVTKPKKIRGEGYKMVNMGELFANPIIDNIQMDRVPLTETEKNSLLKSKDLLFARQSLIRSGAGQCSIFMDDVEDVCFESHIIRCRLHKDKANPLFYFYLFKSNYGREIMDPIIEQGAGASGIRGSDLSKLQVPYVELDKQNFIAEQLYDLDRKIQLNTQINQTLEQIAQTIFKSWFIDFDPVHAKANALASGQTAEQATQAAMAVISGKNTQELHRLQTANPEQYQQLWEIAEAFPSGFDEEGVPWGWEEKSFGELLENTIGGDWGKDEVDEKHTEKVSILRGTDLPNVYKGNDKDVPTRFVEQKKLKSRKLQHSDIVIEVSGGSKNQPTGRSLLITDKLLSRFNNPIVPASFCRLFRPKSENYGYLLALHLQIIYQQGKTWEYQNQSTGISNFQTTHFLETEKVILPTNKTLMYFAEMVYPIFDKIYSNENQKLTEIRDELLPKLLSGEV